MKTICQQKVTHLLGESKEAVRTRPSAILLHLHCLHYFLLLSGGPRISTPHYLPPLQTKIVQSLAKELSTRLLMHLYGATSYSQTISDQQAYFGLIPRPMSLHQTAVSFQDRVSLPNCSLIPRPVSLYQTVVSFPDQISLPNCSLIPRPNLFSKL